MDEDREFDSDRHEDPAREFQLDQSYDAWYRAMKKQIRQAEEMTRAPRKSDVYEAMDDDDF
ncbi:hypothetical protein [Cohnella thermotolerans]|jgi:hypothetical protein|uniref:hypothetical protein n=1 Tax=Cohnella thermotolerans TaxID=329858 RepID=UPI0003FFFC51|nr:hypothetical protein [Cohnella thermotolerans]